MRILHVVPTYLPATRYGGPIHSVHGLCAALARIGHDVHVATTSVDGPDDSAVEHDVPVDLDGVTVWYFHSRVLRRLYYSPPMANTLGTLVPAADVVHLHSVFLWPTSAAARIARRHGVPYVVSPRGMLVRELIERKSRLLKSSWLTLIESTTLAQAAAVHLTSRRELEDARQLPLALANPFVVPNGVDVIASGERTTPQVERLRESGPYVLYLGRLHWKKGLDQALLALAGTDMRLVICGNDDENYRPQLERIAQEKQLGDRVRFEPPVSGADKWALLANAAFVVLPSRNENFGNVAVEAMAAGTAVIVSDQVGAMDLVREADAGLVCGTDLDSLRETMLRLWKQPELCGRLGTNGSAYVARELSWDRVAQRMAERYTAARTQGASCSTTSRR